MLKINCNKTIKELTDKGFIFSVDLLYRIKDDINVFLEFNLDSTDEDYLCYQGLHYSYFEYLKTFKKEELQALNELKESGFVIEC